MNNRPMRFASAHMMAIYALQNARNRLGFMSILHTDDEIDAAAEAAIAEIEKFRHALKVAIPELQMPTPDALDAILRRNEQAKSQVWNASALIDCYTRYHYLRNF